MNRVFLSVISLFFVSMSYAAITIPLYPEYKNATIYLHNRAKVIAPMNYDLAEDKMYYKDGATVMELTLDNPVDSIVWAGEHSFVLKDGKFCEKLVLGGKPVLVQWRLKKVSVGKNGALGMNTQSNNVTEMNLSGMGIYGAGDTGSVENFKYANNNVYFVPTSDGLKRISSSKHLFKFFPSKSEATREYIRQHKLELTRHEDFMTALAFCLQD